MFSIACLTSNKDVNALHHNFPWSDKHINALLSRLIPENTFIYKTIIRNILKLGRNRHISTHRRLKQPLSSARADLIA